jgi:hypothetical protein
MVLDRCPSPHLPRLAVGRTWAENDVFRILFASSATALVALTGFAGRVKAVEGAAPRLLRPMYARANMGHPSREAGIVVSLKRRSQALLPSFPYATVRSVGRGVNAKQAEGKGSVHEGHGFSRAVNGLPTTALAAEVRFSTHTWQSTSGTSGAKAHIGPSDMWHG